ncbi:globin domain-containing protein [Streptomyces griseus]|uniref:globin domain-containing protein n=1 Tax=Streptomyces griseus TaxID=1911 RepID=UPI0004C88840|nr:globin domain-containing protein [Streptomyces griseus]
MLSEQAVPVVRATLPAVGGALDRITERFYGRLFDAHPELLRDLFNRGNQANGDQRKALAGSIAAFAAALLEHPDTRPDALLSRIAHKHASLGVTADQYKIVHEHLFAAIVEVLGEAVTPEVAQAWDEVYWLMANALIALEGRLYQEAGVEDGAVWRPVRITERREETADTVSLTLADPDGSPLPPFRPGQYVSVRVALPDGAHQIRQYSLSSAPGRSTWRITVKRVDGDPAGEVSQQLHAHAAVGDLLEVSAPFGDLVLPEGDGPLLLASAGIGSTPMLSMLDHLAAVGTRRPVVVVHADRSPESHAHAEELRELVGRLPEASLHLWYEEPGTSGAREGRADVTSLEVPAGTSAYLCGPLPFLRAVRGDLVATGVAAADVHYEVFGPDLWLGASA